MLFNSLEFPVFLAVVLAAHYLLIPERHVRARKALLLVASYAFYASWNPLFSFLLAFSTGVDFVAALAMERTQRAGTRRWLVTGSLLVNLGLLGFFKYGRFFGENALALAGRDFPAGSWFDVALPVGISFYTFQSLSYSIDVYRGQQRATRSLLDFALFVSFFPQLVAGPIVRASEMLPQLRGARATSAGDVEQGIARIASGLVKKVVLADTLAMYVERVFAQPEIFGGPEVLLALYAFSFQAYFDFSGYSDIAIGLGRLFGVKLPENFDRPYLATSIREFWQRWHISLSTWLRDYLYVSLGGNRHGRASTLLNLFLTMLLGGLWHGAGWGFVIWGAYQGVLLAAHRAWLWRVGDRPPRTPAWLRRIATFHLLSAGWILFRAPTLEVSQAVTRQLGSWGLDLDLAASQVIAVLALGAALHLGTRSRELPERFLRLPGLAQGGAYALAAFLVYLASGHTYEFIYFQF